MNNAKNKGILIIVSMNIKAATFLKNSLDEVLDGNIEILSHSLLEEPLDRLDALIKKRPKLIAATGEISYQNIKEYCPKENIMLISREISEPEYFDRLFLIPKNKRVLVVNDTQDGTIETIQSLQLLGINHLKYIPYWRDCNTDTEDIDTAISPGMIHLCPPSIQNKIDIGMRRMSIDHFINIINTFNLDLSYIGKYTSRQKFLIINTYKKLSLEYSRAEKLKNSLQTILNKFDDAVISLNSKKQISGINSSAEKLLDISKLDIKNKNINEIFESIPEMNFYDSIDNFKTVIIINNKQIYVTYMPLTINTDDIGMFIFREVKELQKKDEDIRKILYQKNYGYFAKYTFDDIISKSKEVDKVIENAKFLSNSDSTILITGESGTGKELFAQSIHNNSKRVQNPFVAVNFAALPDNLIESELFGYEEGAFTGAKKSGKKGLFELAHTGTIFLDEIGDSSLWVQTRLLRVLEEKEIMRLGDTKKIPINVRVIAATNKDLKKLVLEGKFRVDLYYRINVFRLHIPPLRERKETLPNLIEALLKNNNINKKFSDESIQYIINYNWQGNFRELRNMIEYSALMSKSDIISHEYLPYDITTYQIKQNNKFVNPNTQIIYELKELFDIEHIKYVIEIINSNKNNIKKIGRTTILSILKNYNVNISASTLRTILKHLENYGLIIVGKTKQGTILSPKGEEILEYFKNYNEIKEGTKF